MSMLLQDTVDHSELKAAAVEGDSYDFLIGVVDLVARVDVLHASDDDDSSNTFIIWSHDPTDSRVLRALLTYAETYETIQVHDNGTGIIIVTDLGDR